MASPPANPRAATGAASATTPLSDTTFTLRELLTAALEGPAYDMGAMLFTPAANQDTNTDVANLLRSAHRARVDPDYAEKRARFVSEALQIQKEAAPGQGVADVYVRMEGALDAARRLEGGMMAMLVDLRKEKLRPAAMLSKREEGDTDAEAVRMARLPMDLRGMREALEKKGRSGKGEENREAEGSEFAEEWEKKGVKARKGRKCKGKKGWAKAALS